MTSIVASATIVIIIIYLLPFFVSIVIRCVPPSWLLGTHKADSDYQTRCRVVKTFLNGFADGISFANPAGTRRYSALDSFERPFYVEGAYAGLVTALHVLPWRSRHAVIKFHTQHQQFIFLLAIGFGFASGLRKWWSQSIDERMLHRSSKVDARLQPMVLDGCAFQKMVFHYRTNPASFLKGLTSSLVVRRSFYQGAGRALWFLMPDYESFQAAADRLPAEEAAECYVGFGIAAGFAGLETIAARGMSAYPPGIRESADFYLGLIIGLFARYYTDPDFLESLLLPRQYELLTSVTRAAALFHTLWNNGVSFEKWKAALRNQLEHVELDGAAVSGISRNCIGGR